MFFRAGTTAFHIGRRYRGGSGSGSFVTRRKIEQMSDAVARQRRINMYYDAIRIYYNTLLIVILPTTTIVSVLSSPSIPPTKRTDYLNNFIAHITYGLFIGVTYPISFPAITLYTYLYPPAAALEDESNK
jgi:hypothetical protein